MADKVTPSQGPSGDLDGVHEVKNVFVEVGRSGLTRFGGHVYEEWVKELQGQNGARVYREMKDNDAIIGAFLYALEMIVRQVKWRVEAASDDAESIEAKKFIDECMQDMSISWADTVSEILSMLPFGWCYMELCYKKRVGPDGDTGITRSKHTDGRIGWRKWAIRAQETLWEWQFDDDGSIEAMVQNAPPDYQRRVIPIEKALLFRTRSNKNNPEGRSVLRNAYRSWYFKKNIEEIEAIGIERDLAGLPVMWLPPEIISPQTAEATTALSAYKKMITNIRRDEQEGVLMPLAYDEKGNKMYDIQLLSAGGARRQFDTNQIISRHESRIAMTVLADFIMLGHSQVGTYALGSSKTSMFVTALSSLLESILGTINTYAIPRLMKLNTFNTSKGYPKLVHGDITEVDITVLAGFIDSLTKAGAQMFPDDDLENYLRDRAAIPRKSAATHKMQDEQVRPIGKPEMESIPSKAPTLAEQSMKPGIDRQSQSVSESAIQKGVVSERNIFIRAVKELQEALRRNPKNED